MKKSGIFCFLLVILIGCKLSNYSQTFNQSVYMIDKKTGIADTFLYSVQYYSYKDVLIQTLYKISSVTYKSEDREAFEQKKVKTKYLLVEPGKQKCLEFDLDGNFLREDTSREVRNLFMAKKEMEKPEMVFSDGLNSIRNADDLKDTTINGMLYKCSNPFNSYDSATGKVVTIYFFVKNNSLKTKFSVLGRYPNKFENYCLVGFQSNPEMLPSTLVTLISDIKQMTVEEEVMCKKMYEQAKKMNFN